ncbi:phytoene dehydrogenase [Methylocystaceae bacterium]|nr:phytoene dehydrogenase [Methylocystaceae bacterium]
MKKQSNAIVIGAGFAGIALAIRLQSAGFSTKLIEKRDKPGGRAYVYQDAGFTFDAGPTVITDPSCLEELFELSGRKLSDYVDLIPVAPFYQLRWEDGFIFDYANDQNDLDRQISACSPSDVEGYRRFLAYSKEVLEEGYIKLGHVPFPDFRSMVRVAPQLIRLESYRSVYSKVAQYIKDEHLRQAFSFHSLLVGGNPFTTSAIYALIHALERNWGVWFPRGGTGALVNNGLIRLFKDLGGEVILNSPVKSIETKDNKVVGVLCENGNSFPADIVASNADVMHTYGALLKNEPLAYPTLKSLKNKRYSMSLFVIYFGLKRKHPELKHHIVMFGKRYRELIQEIFKGPNLAQDFSLYLHAPSVTDPSLAPEGSSAYYVLSPVPNLHAANIDWQVEGPKYRDKILDYLEEWILPNLRSDLVTCRIFTPEDFRDELNAHQGSAFSLEPILTQSAYFRAHNADNKIEGLYLVGAGTHPGAGIPGVVGSAKATAGIILSKLSSTGATA